MQVSVKQLQRTQQLHASAWRMLLALVVRQRQDEHRGGAELCVKAAAKRLHPDLFQAPGEKASAETAFKNLLTAYEALKGAEGRQRYQRRPARR